MPVLGRPRQRGCKFKTIVDYIAKSYLGEPALDQPRPSADLL